MEKDRGRLVVLGVLCIITLPYCSQQQGSAIPQSPGARSDKSTPSRVSTLRSPNGSITLGDPIDKAKRAVPTPSNAHAQDRVMHLGPIGMEGWCWVIDDTASPNAGSTYELCVKDGKVAAAAIVRIEPDAKLRQGEVERILKSLPKPDSSAIRGENAIYGWSAGGVGRYVVRIAAPQGLTLVGDFVGSDSDMEKLGYRLDNLNSLLLKVEGSGSPY